MRGLIVDNEHEVAFFYIENEIFWHLARAMFPEKKDPTKELGLATLYFTSPHGTRLHLSPLTSEDGNKIYYDPKEHG